LTSVIRETHLFKIREPTGDNEVSKKNLDQ
jgi:hypothetical protein